jgi:predicted transposase YdaD
MKTDKELYRLFSSCPELLFEAANSKPYDTYEMISITLKEFERRADGFLQPTSENSPVYFVEFQADWDNTIYHRLIMEMAAYGVENPKRDIRGILVFIHKNIDQKTLPWHELTLSKKDVFKVIHLLDYLNELEKKDPKHPLVSTFKPYCIKDKHSLKKNARKWYRNIQKSSLAPQVKESFESVFTRWMVERFDNLSFEEVTKMFLELTPLEKTRSYKELVAIGKKEGKKEGKIEGKIEGKKEGKMEATRRLITRLVANKFNINYRRVAPRLRALRTKDMIEFADNLFSMNSFEDAFQWIDERKKKIKMA